MIWLIIGIAMFIFFFFMLFLIGANQANKEYDEIFDKEMK